jgi:putative MATE family efflux protein
MFDVSPEGITEGPLLRALAVLSAPLLAQNLVLVAQEVIDLFWLGRLSGEAVAATGFVFPVMALLFALAVFAPFVGTQVLVSQRIGGEDLDGGRRAVFTGLAVAIGGGLLVGVPAYLGARPLLELLALAQPEAITDTVTRLGAAYLGVIALGLPVLAATDAAEASFVGWGDSRASLWMNLLAVGANLALDPLLIFGIGPFPALGIEGAALATVLGSAFGLVLAAGFVLRGRNDGMVSRAAARIDTEEIRELLDVGLPTAGQQVASQSVRIVIVAVVFAAGGAAGLAAYIVGARVATVAFVPAQGLQQATQSVVGQNLGAGNPGRANRTTWLGVSLAVGVLSVVGVLQWLVPGAIATLLVPELSGAAFSLSVTYLEILAYGYPAIGAVYLFQGGFNGARRTRVSFLASVVQYWAIRLPIALLGAFALGFGVNAVFWAVTLSNIAAALGLGWYYRYSARDGMFERATEVAASAAD